MDALIFYILAFLVGAIPFAEYARRIVHPKKTIKVTHKEKARGRLYFLLDPWVGVGFSILDVLKAFLITYLSDYYFDSYLIISLSAFALVLGQFYSPFAKNIRGRGLSALIGTLLFLDIRLLATAGLLYLLILSFFHYTRLSLLLVAMLLPIVAYFFSENIYTVLFLLLCFILLVVVYLPNIQNYMHGREPTATEEFKKRNRSI